MFRMKIIYQSAVQRGFFTKQKQLDYETDYNESLKKTPTLSFIDWAKRENVLNDQQIKILKQDFLATKLKCKKCDDVFAVASIDYSKPLKCPSCQFTGFEIYKTGSELESDNNNKNEPILTEDMSNNLPLTIQQSAVIGELMPGDTIYKTLEIIKKVGQGGMGSVYKAKHINLDVLRAVKILNSHLTQEAEQKARFVREAKSAAALDHQNIMKVHNVAEFEGKLFIEMEWVNGESLQNKINNNDHLSLEETVDYVIQSAKGLYHAHRKGIIHRDIKPDNLMVTEDNAVKIADFGLAKATQSEKDMQISHSGSILGTPYYMSPEQAQNKQVDFLSDIYSLGVTFYHLITGKVPYVGESAIQVLFQHIKDPFPSIRKDMPEIPVEIDQLILRMTAKNPQLRPQSLLEVIEELEGIRQKYQLEPIRVTEFRTFQGKKVKFKKPKTEQKKGAITAFVFVIIICLLAGGTFIWWEFGNLSEIWNDFTNGDQITTNLTDETDSDNNVSNNGVDNNTDNNQIDNSHSGDNDNNVEPVNDVETKKALRETEARERYQALMNYSIDAKEGTYTEYINKFKELSEKYKDTAVVSDINLKIDELIQKRNNSAKSWWNKYKSDYENLSSEKRYIEAYEILDKFPSDYTETIISSVIISCIEDVKPKKLLEEDAVKIYKKFLQIIGKTDITELEISNAQKLYDQLNKNYKNTRFGAYSLEMETQLKNADTRYKEKKYGNIYSDLIKNIDKKIDDDDYEGALRELGTKKDFFASTDWEIRLESKIKEVNDKVNKKYSDAIKIARMSADEGKYLDAVNHIKPVLIWGLEDMKKQALTLTSEYRVKHIDLELSKFEGENPEAGLEKCEEMLKDPMFSNHLKYLEYRKKRFTLVKNGFVIIPSVKVPGLKCENASEKAEWESKEFFITKFEITNAQFQKFIDDAGYSKKEFWSEDGWKEVQAGTFENAARVNAPKHWGAKVFPTGEDNLPVGGISYLEASAFSKYMGWQLPTLEQWLVAAGWNEKTNSWQKYPWGDSFIQSGKIPANLKAKDVMGKASEIGKHENDVSFFGVFDCGGNLRELTRTFGSDGDCVVAGGDFLSTEPEKKAQTTYNTTVSKTKRQNNTGFRCIITLQKP